MDSKDITIPIYLDVNIFMDIYASIEDGFNMVENVTTRSIDTTNTKISTNMEFAISGIINFIGLNTKGSVSASDSGENQKELENKIERYHTYGSLLNRFRKKHLESGLIKKVSNDNWNTINSSDFIEIEGTFYLSSLYEIFQTLYNLVEVGISYQDAHDKFNEVSKKLNEQLPNLLELRNKVKKLEPREGATEREIKQHQNALSDLEKLNFKIAPIQAEYNDLQSILLVEKIIGLFLKDMDRSGVRNYIVYIKDMDGYKAVVPLQSQFNKDLSGFEIPYGNYKVLGKVVKRLDEGEKIDLLKGSVLSAIEESKINDMITGMQNTKDSGLVLPQQQMIKVEYPALQIKPIAVYI